MDFNDKKLTIEPMFDSDKPRTRPKLELPWTKLMPEDIAKPGTESANQKALFAWAALHRPNCPELELLHAIPNGGKRDLVTASRMKAEGQRAGVPDIFWPIARGGFHGLYIEMKTEKGVVSPLQEAWIALLLKQGYAVKLAYSWQEGSEALIWYYQLP